MSLTKFKIVLEFDFVIRQSEGYGDTSTPVPMQVLSKYDNMSYVTQESFKEIADLLNLGEGKRLLDFGCGIAGPMRSVAQV